MNSYMILQQCNDLCVLNNIVLYLAITVLSITNYNIITSTSLSVKPM